MGAFVSGINYCGRVHPLAEAMEGILRPREALLGAVEVGLEAAGDAVTLFHDIQPRHLPVGLIGRVERALQVGPVPAQFALDQGRKGRRIVGGGHLAAAVAEHLGYGQKVIGHLNLRLVKPLVRGHGLAQCFPSRYQ